MTDQPTLALILLDGREAARIDRVASLVAGDASGQFGVQPGHAALVTVIEPGLFRYRLVGSETWTWCASAGGMLSCQRDAGATTVRIVSRRFLRGADAEWLQSQLEALLQREHSLRVTTRESRDQLDIAFYKRMQQLAQERA
jgi:F-type H+-transporting ATPase subunit epsilon